jgi:putative addiction module component (TIGR02574 family)
MSFYKTAEIFSETRIILPMDIHSLSTPERILLAEQLWDSVRDKSDEIDLTPEQTKILQSRLAALESDGDHGDSWENVKARITKS